MCKNRIKDSEPCPCGSSIPFKDCCKGNETKVNKSRKPPEVQIMEKMRASMEKCCLHPDKANCNGKIKSAHALQNNKIISLLAGVDRHVYMLDAKKQPILIPLDMSLSLDNDTQVECVCLLRRGNIPAEAENDTES